MDVRYIHAIDKDNLKVAANIMWDGKWPMRKGEFPADHPCAINAAGLERFRTLGYWAGPFPEGDGITMDAKGRPAEQVVRDIEECFGWNVENYKPGWESSKRFAALNEL